MEREVRYLGEMWRGREVGNEIGKERLRGKYGGRDLGMGR